MAARHAVAAARTACTQPAQSRSATRRGDIVVAPAIALIEQGGAEVAERGVEAAVDCGLRRREDCLEYSDEPGEEVLQVQLDVLLDRVLGDVVAVEHLERDLQVDLARPLARLDAA